MHVISFKAKASILFLSSSWSCCLGATVVSSAVKIAINCILRYPLKNSVCLGQRRKWQFQIALHLVCVRCWIYSQKILQTVSSHTMWNYQKWNEWEFTIGGRDLKYVIHKFAISNNLQELIQTCLSVHVLRDFLWNDSKIRHVYLPIIMWKKRIWLSMLFFFMYLFSLCIML